MKETLFYATCTPGLEDDCAQWMETMPLRITRIMSGGLLFVAHHPPEQYKVPFLNLMFRVLKTWEPAGEPMNFLLGSIVGLSRPPLGLPTAEGAFRIVTMKENKPVAVDPAALRAAEKRIAHWTGHPLARAKADHEYWVLFRCEGFGLWMLRLWGGGERREAGRLRAELAQSLAYLALPPGGIPPAGQNGAAVLDPFAGSGAIAEALWLRAGQPRVGPVIAVDNHPQTATALISACEHTMRTKAALPKGDRLCTQSHTGGRSGPGWWAFQGDARALPLPDASVSAICSDPPWGEHQVNDKNLFQDFIKEATRIAANGARMVLLGPPALQTVLEQSAWKMQKVLPVLVSGHKAKIYVLLKPSFDIANPIESTD